MANRARSHGQVLPRTYRGVRSLGSIPSCSDRCREDTHVDAMNLRHGRQAFGLLAWASVACGSRNIGPPEPLPSDTSLEVQLAVGIPAKIDLLFLIDNSSSMADKEDILAQAVPDLVSRLVDPVCVDPVTGRQVGTRGPGGSCAIGRSEFNPIE